MPLVARDHLGPRTFSCKVHGLKVIWGPAIFASPQFFHKSCILIAGGSANQDATQFSFRLDPASLTVGVLDWAIFLI